MIDVEALFNQALDSVRRGNERRMEDAKQKSEKIIANAMLRKAAKNIASDDEETILNALRLIDGYRKLKSDK